MRIGRIAIAMATAIILCITLLGMTPSQSKAKSEKATTAPNPTSALYPIHQVNKTYPFTHGHQSCGRIEFTVNAEGKPEDLRVWSHYLLPDITHRIGKNWLVPNFFDQFVMNELTEWRFHPRVEHGEPVPTTHVIRDYELTSLNTFKETLIYSSFPRKRESSSLILLGSRLRGNDENIINQTFLKIDKTIFQGWEALTWLCSLPPMHGVPIVAAPGTVSKASQSIMGVRARDGKTIDLGPGHVSLGVALLPRKHGDGEVWLQLCIDVDSTLKCNG